MIRILSACVVGSLLAAPDARAAPKPERSERPARPAASLESPDPAVRRDAITKLVAERDPAAVAQLALALDGDDDEAVRQAAASGLGELADKRAIGALRRCLQREASQVVKRSCRVSLARLDPDAVMTDPEPSATAPTAAAVGPAAPGVSGAPLSTSAEAPGAAPASSQLDLRINVTAQDAAERPNHVYLELWSALDKNTLAIGYERVIGPHWTVAVEPQFQAESQSAAGMKVSATAVSLAVRPHFYFLQQAPSGPYIAPVAALGYVRVTVDFPPEFPEADDKVSGTVWSVGAGVGWSIAVNARAVFKLSAVFAYTKTAATIGGSGIDQTSSSAAFSPFVSAGVMF
jgi:HEAT repeats